MENKHNFMETESITKLLIKFSLPAIIGMFVNALYNIVDRIYIGNIKEVGHLGITGVGVVFPVVIFTFAFTLLIGNGAAARISLKLGEKDIKYAERVLGITFLFSLIVAALLMVITFLSIDKLIYFLGGSKETFFYAKEYLKYIILGTPAAIIGFSLNASIRADGSPKISMLTILIGAITNIVLDPIFIFYFNMGVKGAAIATIISQYISALWTIHYFTSEKSRISLRKKNIIFDFKEVKKICALGSSNFAVQIGFSLITYVLNNILKKYGGDISIGAMTVIQSIMTFITMPIFGINQGVLPILGYNYGAKQYGRVKETLFKGIIASMSICTIGYIMLKFQSERLTGIFTDDFELQNLARYGLNIYTMVFPLVGFQVVGSVFFQALGKPKMSILISLSRQILVMIPCLFILSKLFGLEGIWYATPVSDSIAAIVTFVLLRREIKNLNRLETQKDEDIQILNF